jgi:hypothetical protein
MKRFLETLFLLSTALLLLASAVNATLDHMASSPVGNSFTGYDDKGQVVVSYQGPPALGQNFNGTVRVPSPVFLHRT